MRYISASIKRAVIQRANNRCEYCHLSQKGQAATFHIDHILPINADGKTVLENLALACVACSLYKAAKISATDPMTEESAAIFNPRKDAWRDHFEWSNTTLLGRTAIGRATIHALKMNRPMILEIRREEAFFGRHP